VRRSEHHELTNALANLPGDKRTSAGNDARVARAQARLFYAIADALEGRPTAELGAVERAPRYAADGPDRVRQLARLEEREARMLERIAWGAIAIVPRMTLRSTIVATIISRPPSTAREHAPSARSKASTAGADASAEPPRPRAHVLKLQRSFAEQRAARLVPASPHDGRSCPVCGARDHWHASHPSAPVHPECAIVFGRAFVARLRAEGSR
jgi:hypothetical protein